LAARIGAFEALLCYAKITPAVLRRGEFAWAGCKCAEALGCNLKFKPGDWRPSPPAHGRGAFMRGGWPQVEQGVPAA
jgi:hypothetical protein